MNTLKEAEQAIINLSRSEKAQLWQWMAHDLEDAFPGIETTSNVLGGAACIRQTRIAVWMLEQARRLGISEAELLRNYPNLTAQDLANAWSYVRSHTAEVESQIAANESDEA